MFLVSKNQKTQPLQSEIFPEISVADGILFILFNDFLPVIRLISRSCIYNKFYLVFYFDKKFISVKLSFDKLYGMPHQLHKTVIVRKLSLTVRNISHKWGALLDMSCDINRAFCISIIVPVADILFEQSLPHSCLEVIRKQEQQKIEQSIVLIGIGVQIYDVWKVQHFV